MRSFASIVIFAAVASSAYAQVGYNPYAGYEQWQNSSAYYYTAPPYGYVGRGYARGYGYGPVTYRGYGFGYNDVNAWRRAQALEDIAQGQRNIERAIRDQTFQQQLDAHAARMQRINEQ